MTQQPRALPLVAHRPYPLATALVLSFIVCACAGYCNLSFLVKDRSSYVYFPPFIKGVNANDNRHLGAEYWNIARSMCRGEGFANPFPGRTGPTAWMPPVLPVLLAGLHWACEGEADAVMAVFLFLQTLALVFSGLLVLEISRRTTRLWPVVPAGLFLLALFYDFRLWFQHTHDCWIVLLFADLVLAGMCLAEPLRSRWSAAGWGLFGGLCALTSPIVGFAWGGLTLADGLRQRAWARLAVALLAAAVALTPWTVRNFLVFGRLIPVKSNLAYEAYQSQCLQKDGLLQNTTFNHHPYGQGHQERKEYQTLGETAFIDHKREQFLQSMWADPADFLDRVAARFLGATLWYVPMDRSHELRRPRITLALRVIHPLPALALLTLLFLAVWNGADRSVWMGIGLYGLYLTPYIAVSYYDRYAAPLLAVKALLTVWAVSGLLSLASGLRRPTVMAHRALPAPAAGKERAVPASS